MTTLDASTRKALLRQGFALEYVTLGWNVVGIVVLATAAVAARSVALAGFGLDSLIEIGASTVVIWELSGADQRRQEVAQRLIGYVFATLAVYLLVQSTVVLATGFRPGHSLLGITWTALTAAVLFALAASNARTGRALGNPVLRTEGGVTLIDGILAAAVLLGLVLNAVLGWWWADPAAALVIAALAVNEGIGHRDLARRLNLRTLGLPGCISTPWTGSPGSGDAAALPAPRWRPSSAGRTANQG